MKKAVCKYLIFLIIVLTALFALGIFGCADNNAEGEADGYTVRYLAEEGGYLVGETEQHVKAGESGSPVSVQLNRGYAFTGWSDGNGRYERVDENVNGDITVTAMFEKIKYTLTYLSSEGGTVRGECRQNVDMFSPSSSVTAVADEGFIFIGWSDGSPSEERCEEGVESNLEFIALFERINITVNYVAGVNGTLTGNCVQTVPYGGECTEITAVPNEGYIFSGWDDGVKEAVRRDTPKDDATLTALFTRAFGGGDGTPHSPYTISSYSQLRNIVYYPQAYYKLVSDLDLSGVSHAPLFEDGEGFGGELDGNGKKIKNLYVNTVSQYPSLFGVIGNAFVKNLVIENAEIYATDFDAANGNYCVGILSGISAGFLQGVTASGKITVQGLRHSGVAVGGLVGDALFPLINCNADVNILASDISVTDATGATAFNIGGLAGVCMSWALTNCGATGKIRVSSCNLPQACVGGLIGYMFTGSIPANPLAYDAEVGEETGEEVIGAYIENCRSAVNVEQENAKLNAGGLISVLNGYAEICGCYAQCTINATNAAGFIYECNSDDKTVISDCYAVCTVNAVSGYGFAYKITECDVTNCYAQGTVGASETAAGFVGNARRCTLKNVSSECNLTAVNSAGLIYTATNCGLENCSFSGQLNCENIGATICVAADTVNFKNCYSRSEVSVNNSTGSRNLRVGGLFAMAIDSSAEGCYFAGGITFANEHASANIAILGGLKDSNVTNCHVLNCCGLQVVCGVNGQSGVNVTDITEYDRVVDMYLLADALNSTNQAPVWQNVEGSTPILLSNI